MMLDTLATQPSITSLGTPCVTAAEVEAPIAKASKLTKPLMIKLPAQPPRVSVPRKSPTPPVPNLRILRLSPEDEKIPRADRRETALSLDEILANERSVQAWEKVSIVLDWASLHEIPRPQVHYGYPKYARVNRTGRTRLNRYNKRRADVPPPPERCTYYDDKVYEALWPGRTFVKRDLAEAVAKEKEEAEAENSKDSGFGTPSASPKAKETSFSDHGSPSAHRFRNSIFIRVAGHTPLHILQRLIETKVTLNDGTRARIMDPNAEKFLDPTLRVRDVCDLWRWNRAGPFRLLFSMTRFIDEDRPPVLEQMFGGQKCDKKEEVDNMEELGNGFYVPPDIPRSIIDLPIAKMMDARGGGTSIIRTVTAKDVKGPGPRRKSSDDTGEPPKKRGRKPKIPTTPTSEVKTEEVKAAEAKSPVDLPSVEVPAPGTSVSVRLPPGVNIYELHRNMREHQEKLRAEAAAQARMPHPPPPPQMNIPPGMHHAVQAAWMQQQALIAAGHHQYQLIMTPNGPMFMLPHPPHMMVPPPGAPNGAPRPPHPPLPPPPTLHPLPLPGQPMAQAPSPVTEEDRKQALQEKRLNLKRIKQHLQEVKVKFEDTINEVVDQVCYGGKGDYQIKMEEKAKKAALGYNGGGLLRHPHVSIKNKTPVLQQMMQEVIQIDSSPEPVAVKEEKAEPIQKEERPSTSSAPPVPEDQILVVLDTDDEEEESTAAVGTMPNLASSVEPDSSSQDSRPPLMVAESETDSEELHFIGEAEAMEAANLEREDGRPSVEEDDEDEPMPDLTKEE